LLTPTSDDARVASGRRLSRDWSTFALATIFLVTAAFAIAFGYLQEYKLSPFASLYGACLIISFYIIGVGLKFVDDAYDRNRFSKKAAHLVLVGGTLLGVTLTWLDIWVASIFLALLIAVALTGKVNQRLFLIPALVFFFFLFALGDLYQLHWAFVVVAATAALADELGSEFAKRHLEKFAEGSPKGWEKARVVALRILRNRFIAVCVLLVLAMVKWLPFLYWFAWLALDFGYTVLEAISSRMSSRELLQALVELVAAK